MASSSAHANASGDRPVTPADTEKVKDLQEEQTESKKKQQQKQTKRKEGSKKRKALERTVVELRRIIIQPSDKPYSVTWLKDEDDTLHLMQQAVSGHIELYPLQQNKHKLDLYVNEEGLLLDLPVNKHLLKHLGVRIVGTAILARADRRGADADLPDGLNEHNWHEYLQ